MRIAIPPIVCLAALLTLAGCGSDSVPSSAASGPATAAAEGQTQSIEAPESQLVPPETPTAPVEPELTLGDRLRADLPDLLTELAQLRAWERAIMEVTEAELYTPMMGPRRKELVREIYTQLQFRPAFTELQGGGQQRRALLLQELGVAHQHAIDTSPYRLNQIDEAIEAADAHRLPDAPEWEIDDWDPIVEIAERVPTTDPEQAILETARLIADLVPGEDAPDARIRVAFAQYRRQLSRELAPQLRHELLLANAFLSYTYDIRHANVSGLTASELREGGGERSVRRARIRQTFFDMAAADPHAFGVLLDALIPRHRQYQRLMTSLARYRAGADAGGWERVSSRAMSIGSDNLRVQQLKTRLQLEGYYDGPLDTVYDEALAVAVSSYQESHQLEVTGEPHEGFWRSLNVPVERRIRQIEVTLQRWRESRIPEDEDTHVFINIPDFTAELWWEGELQERFRVVVGSNQRHCDPATNTMQYVNATPMVSSQIEYMVYNPYWNVPARIREEELDVALMENPAWLQENGYEVLVTEFGARIRQLPGDHNALGQVKFIFPNDFGIYMHDTPHRRYFDFNIRAYSHGCVRVQQPMDFAERLLTNDGTWDSDRIQGILDNGRERVVRLETPIPVHIEYYVVRVDEAGRTHFLADVYRYDRQRMGDYEPEECVPDEVATEGVVWNDEDGSATLPDGTQILADGTVVAPEILPDDPLALQPSVPTDGRSTPDSITPGPQRTLVREPVLSGP